MRDFFIGLAVGVFLTGATAWYFTVARKHPRVQRAWDTVEARLTAWHLRGEDIQQELARTGRVVRRQVREFSTALAESGADAAITAKIKGKMAVHEDLSALSISVNTTDGHVTMAGRVRSHDQIGKAILVALETDGVKDVTSNLQVKK